MKKTPLAFLAAVVLCCSVAAQSQTPVQTPAQAPGPSLEERYTQCIRTALCPLQTRLQIIQEEANDMNVHFQKIFETCAVRSFQGCVDNQEIDMDMWHSADYRAGQMMLSIEAQSLALKEASAGGPDKQQIDPKGKSLWDRIWGK